MEQFSKFLNKSAIFSGVTYKKVHVDAKDNPWFDNECLIEKSELTKLSKSIAHNNKHALHLKRKLSKLNSVEKSMHTIRHKQNPWLKIPNVLYLFGDG